MFSSVFRCVQLINARQFHAVRTLKPPKRHNLQKLRYLTTSTVSYVKLYTDTENIYAHKILQTIPVADNAIFTLKPPNQKVTTTEDFERLLDQNWRKKTATEILEAFKNVSDYCMANNIPLSDKRFDRLVDGFVDHVEKLTDDQMSDFMICLQKFPWCSSYDAHNFHDIWSALDDICLIRMHEWPVKKRYYFADLWYRLNLARICAYNFEFTDKLIGYAARQRLSKEEIVHTFFYLNICRRRKIDFELEYALEKVVDELSADEMGIVAMGYFKTETKIKLLPIVDAMCRKIIAEHDTMHEITLAAILKALRFSSLIKAGEMYYAVLDCLTSEIERMSNLSLIHIALLGTHLQIVHKDCLERVTEKLMRDLEKTRIKEIERLLLATAMFDFEPQIPDFYQKCLLELKKESRRLEKAQYSRCLPSALNYLSIRNLYDYDLLNEILDDAFIEEVYGKRATPRELMFLDYNIDVECPDYTGNRLQKNMRAVTMKVNSERIPSPDCPKHSIAGKLFLNVKKTIDEITGSPDLSLAIHILPHFSKADIILCKDVRSGRFVKPEGFEKYVLADLKRPELAEHLKWYAVVVLAYNQTVRDTATPLGLMKMKARQLKAFGFKPVIVSLCYFLSQRNFTCLFPDHLVRCSQKKRRRTTEVHSKQVVVGYQ